MIKTLNFKNILINTLLVFFSICFSFIIIELFLRINSNQIVKKSSLPKEIFLDSSISLLRPGFRGKFENQEIDAEIKINSKGIRYREIDYLKPNNEIRILGLGDSFTFSYTKEEHSFLYLLEEALNSRNYNKKIKVINAGVPGVGPDFYLNYYENEGAKYDSDIILINFYIGNDIININEKLKSKTSKKSISKQNYFYKVKTWLRINSKLYSLLVTKIKSIPKIRKTLNDNGIAPDILESYNKNSSPIMEKKWKILESILQQFKNFKGELLISIIPSIYQIDENSSVNFLDGLDSSYDIMYPTERFKKILHKRNVKFIDITEILRNENKSKDLIYSTDGHFNYEANKIIANEIFKKMEFEYLNVFL